MHLDAGQPYLLNASSATELSFNIQNNYHAVVGIGFPQRFYQTLKGLEVKQFQEHAFRDHHDYSIDDLLFNDDQPIITTEKMQLSCYHYLKSIQNLNDLFGSCQLKLFCLQSAIRF